MKTLKLILTNLILVFTLVILTSGMVFADGITDVNITVNRDSNNKPISYELQVIKDGKVATLDEIFNTHFEIKNSEYQSSIPISFWVDNVTLDEPLEEFVDYFPNWFIQTGNLAGTGDIKFDYDINKKVIIIKPKNTDYVGSTVNSLDIIVTETLSNGREKKTKVVKSTPLPIPNVDFSIFYSFDSSTKYFLQIEGATFRELGNVGIYDDGELMQSTNHEWENYFPLGGDAEPYLTLVMKNEASSQEYGRVFIEDYESVVFEDDVQNGTNAEIICKTESGTQISFSELKKYGWNTLYLKNKTNDTQYALNLNSLTFNSGNGQVSADGKTLILPTKGEYEIWVNNPSGGKAISQKLTSVEKSAFTARLEEDGLVYTLVLEKTIEELKAYNGNKNYKIIIEDLAGNELGSYDSYNKFLGIFRTAKNEKTLTIDKELYKYEKINVRFKSDETGLNEVVTLDVPKLAQFNDISIKIICEGGLSFFDSEENEVTLSEIALSLGLEKNNHPKFNLRYETGSESIDGYSVADPAIGYWSITSFDSVANDYEKLKKSNEYYKTYLYFKKVVESGRDLPLMMEFYREDNPSKKVQKLVEKPDIASAYPYLEAFTGKTIEEVKEIVKKIDELILSNTELVEDGKLTVGPNEEKEFRINLSGNYYIHDPNTEQYVIVEVAAYSKGLLAKSGVLTGTTKDNKPEGKYIYYDPQGLSAVTYIEDFGKANCYPLIENCVYKIENISKQTVVFEFIKVDAENGTANGELVEINDEKSSYIFHFQSEGHSGVNGRAGIVVGYIVGTNKSFFAPLTEMISRFIMSLANGLNYLVQLSLRAVGGEELTTTVDIDSIIFNQYPDTSIAFFESNTGGDNPSKLIGMFRDSVNEWYGKFRGIAIAGYLIILLYIGVRILLNVGGQKQAQYKELLSHWLVGIVLLVLFPYAIRYAIEINNLFVGMIAESKSGVLKITDVNYQIDMSGFDLPSMANKDNIAALQSQMDEIPFADEDTSYMAVMARRGAKSGKIVDAVVYLIMVWQFIMIVIMYYRRVFTVAFLIVIFPFVTLSYAIDKVADGKAQAFATWTKELMINIFVQSIHAVVYVFVIGATYSAGEYNGDWLLSIIGITFLFKGEEILKKLINQGGETTVKSLAKTATRAVLTVKAAQKVTKSVSDNFIGRDSHLGRTINTYRQWKTEEKVARNMDFLGKPAYQPPAGNSLDTYDSTLPSSPDYDELADDIQIANNAGKLNDPERIAKAMKNIMANRNSTDPAVQNLMMGLNLSDDQLNEFGRLQNEVTQEYLNGDKSTEEKRMELKASIDSKISARMRLIFPELNDPSDPSKRAPLTPDKQRRANNLKAAMFVMLADDTDRATKHRRRNTDYVATKREFVKTEERLEKFYNPDEMVRKGIHIPFSEEAKKPKLSTRATAKRDSILATHYGTNATNASKQQLKMAESIAIMSEFKDLSDATVPTADTQVYTAKQYMDAANYVAEHEGESRESRNAVRINFSVTGREMVSVVAEQITKTYTDVSAEPSGDHRRAIARGAKAEIPEPLRGTAIEKGIAVRNTHQAYDEAQEIVKKEDEEYGTRMYYDSSLDRFEAKDVINREHHPGYDLDTYVGYMVRKREEQNEREAIEVEDFAREMLDDIPTYANEPTYEGLTQREHEEYAENLRDKFVEELTRTGVTTVGATLGAPIGAGLAIGLSDDESAITEGLVGAAGGIFVGDQIAENAMGKELSKGGRSKKVKILNPYTNEIEEFELKKDGITADATLIALINSGEVLRYDDPRLDQYSYNLNRQFIEHKVQKQRQRENDRRRQMFDEALRNSRN